MVSILLLAKANPNARALDGSTPCYGTQAPTTHLLNIKYPTIMNYDLIVVN